MFSGGNWAARCCNQCSSSSLKACAALRMSQLFCWLGVIKPIDTYIAEHQSHAQKIKKDIKWMQDQASTHG
ncbi:type II secretion system protein GspM, partial [Escherichia coli]